MDCAEEVGALRRELEPLDGVLELRFDLLEEKLVVDFVPGRVDPPALRRAVRRTGLRAEDWGLAAETGSGPRFDSRALLCLASGAALAAAFGVHAGAQGFAAALGGEPPVAARALYLSAALFGARWILPKAWSSVRRLRPDMNLLMLVAAAGAIGIGEWFEAAAVVFLFNLSLLLESWSVGRARKAVARLLDVAPREVSVLHEPGQTFARCGTPACGDHEHPDTHHEHRVELDSVRAGDRLLVRPGERLPVDGEVLAGSSFVDQAGVTGEPVPVEKTTGDAVFSGTLNGVGTLEVLATASAERSTQAGILRLVGEARRDRSRSERWVERFAAVYTPLVLAAALLFLAVQPLLLGRSGSDSLYNALVLLVIACPCALVISTPVSVVCALARAARLGILVKGGSFVERPAAIRCIAFDKTGTLTEGKPELRAVVPVAEVDEDGALALAAALEAGSEHPLARALVAAAATRGSSPAPVRGLQAVPGLGAEAEIDGQLHWIGSGRLMAERAAGDATGRRALAGLEAGGDTVVALGRGHRVLALFALRDCLRPGAGEALAALRASGGLHLVMLTGDGSATAQRIGRELGLDEVRAGLLPADKEQEVAALRKERGPTAMVGDGLNDAPAMARSDLGVAMGGAGSDLTAQAADVVVLAAELDRLPWFWRHSHRTLRTIRQNVFASLTVKAVFLVLALAGWSTLWLAVAADMGVSLIVVANAMRLLGGPAAGGQPAQPALNT